MSRHDKSNRPPLRAAAIAPHLAAAARYPQAPLAVAKPCAYCNRPASYAFALPHYGNHKQLFLCHEHKGHEQA